jgi:hypothetical protein
MQKNNNFIASKGKRHTIFNSVFKSALEQFRGPKWIKLFNLYRNVFDLDEHIYSRSMSIGILKWHIHTDLLRRSTVPCIHKPCNSIHPFIYLLLYANSRATGVNYRVRIIQEIGMKETITEMQDKHIYGYSAGKAKFYKSTESNKMW